LIKKKLKVLNISNSFEDQLENIENEWIDNCDSDLELENEIGILKNINRKKKKKINKLDKLLKKANLLR
jgi:hypothetical protein